MSVKPIISAIICVSITCGLLSGCIADSGKGTTGRKIYQITDTARIKSLAHNFEAGRHRFQSLCSPCHYAPERRITCQYIFNNLFDRLPEPAEGYFIKYIRDSKSLKASGNKYALAIDKEYDQDYEHLFKDSLSQQDLYNLIVYIKVAVRMRYNNALN